MNNIKMDQFDEVDKTSTMIIVNWKKLEQNMLLLVLINAAVMFQH